MSHVKESILHFPCDYLIKIEGGSKREFEPKIREIIELHAGKLDNHQIISKNKGRVISLTVRIVANSREQIDNINHDLTNCPLVEFIL
ncbi:MAG: DUF493 domain-containing protein [Gammaproteobacteria bacterium]|nr:DUF493 domain-containing protein [Gammaproteobacteria bacterium]